MEQKMNARAGQLLDDYRVYLYQEERSANTIAKYLRDLRAFLSYLGEREIGKEILVEWKSLLVNQHLPASVNSMLAAVNGFLIWLGLPQLKVKPLRIQRETYRKPERELNRDDYFRLIKSAEKKKNTRLSLLLQTICTTGIRVSELPYITAAAVRTGRAQVKSKGKSRVVFLPEDLCRRLLQYCRTQKIKDGILFRTRNGRPIDRTNIWKAMKALCADAKVDPHKVFPHNLRHLFARTYYAQEKDLSRLADLLGHTSVTTTRIYTMESGMEHVKQINRLGRLFFQNKMTT